MKIFSFLLLGLFFTGSLLAETLQVGDTLPSFTVENQHGESFTYEGQLDFLLVSFDMAAGKQTNVVLSEKPKNYLSEKKAAFLSNIYGMPSIGRYFALRKMRKYPHNILLGDSEDLLVNYPKEEGKVTVLKLDKDKKIEAITFWDPTTENLDTLLTAN
ncbi:MAG: hypothetical protein ACK5LK_09555 [Chthoniobacterales bacterium]